MSIPQQADTRYRADIDGLRAVAILSVLAYHAGFDFMPGGFVGVDVFFVISGFLITRLIRSATIAGRFTYSGFYVRRARRLFPALFFTLVVSFIAAILILPPEQLERFGGAFVYSMLSGANFFFWMEAGYFDTASELKPLLHMWSLSVEEQFYLVWPIALVTMLVSLPRRTAPIVLMIIAVTSLWLSQIWLDRNPVASFFLTPFRAFELAIGGLMVWVVHYRPPRDWFLEPILLAGLGLILYSALRFSMDTPFPGYHALIPTVGSAMVIYAGTAPLSGRLLSNRAMVGIGLISYSLYLIHWPMIVFYRHVTLWEPEGLARWVLVIGSLVVATGMYRFVEQPFRLKKGKSGYFSPRAFGLACAGLAAIVIVPAAHTWTHDGWPWRMNDQISVILSDLGDKQTETWSLVRGENNPAVQPYANDPSSTKILVLGDSHSKDMFNALFLNRDRMGNIDVRRLAFEDRCLGLLRRAREPRENKTNKEIRKCEQDLARLKTSPLLSQADWIIYADRWRANRRDSIEFRHVNKIGLLVREFEPLTQARWAVSGNTAEFTAIPPLLRKTGSIGEFNSVATAHRVTGLDAENEALRQRVENLGILFIDRAAAVCGDRMGLCVVLGPDNELLIYDYGHWTLDGAEYYGRRLLDSGALDPIFEP